MGLLNQQGKKGDKKSNSKAQKVNAQQSKFISKGSKPAGGSGGKLVSGPNKTVTDGPYTEGKEVVGGFFLVNARDLDEAVEISKDCPDYELGGSVQVRQVMKMDM